MGVSENSGIPKSSILIGFSIINHGFGVPLFSETPIYVTSELIISTDWLPIITSPEPHMDYPSRWRKKNFWIQIVSCILYPWAPKPWNMKVLNPQYMGYNP